MSVVVVQTPTNPPPTALLVPNGNGNAPTEKFEQPKSKSIIGIIYPPPEVRNIIDRTAEFVARNGAAYEAKVRDSETGNNKFNFLYPADPYHNYYRHRVNEFKEGKAVPTPQMQLTPHHALPVPRPPTQAIQLDSLVPKEPPPEFEFIFEPPSISSLDIDVVKLTALFTATHGRSFVNKLMDKEQKNSQFDFLRPQHCLFTFFNKLVEQYQRVLIPPKNILDSLSRDIYSAENLSERVEKRFHWNTYQKRQRQGEEEKSERERVAYAQIDWHDFVVVETINFTEEETGYFPPPVTPHTLTARLVAQAKHESRARGGPVREEGEEPREVEMEDELVQEVEPLDAPQEEVTTPAPAAPLINTAPPVQEGDIIIRPDYDPKARPQAALADTDADKFLTSPITGEIIPPEKATSHVKHLLVDSKWRESQSKLLQQQAQGQTEVYAEGSQITQSLWGLAKRRTDIFGSGTEETVIGQTIGEEQLGSKPGEEGGGQEETPVPVRHIIEEPPKIGPPAIPQKQPVPPQPHSVEAAPVPAPPPPVPHPMTEVRPSFPMQPPNPVMIPRNPLPGAYGPSVLPPQPFMQPRPPAHFPPPQPDQGAKRARTEEDCFLPEEEYLRMHPGPVAFRVHCPQMSEKPEWHLNGQILNVSLPVTDQVSVIKAKISSQIDMPIGKQKLQLGTVFLKDSHSLAHYNFSEESVVQLLVKERGGRKK